MYSSRSAGSLPTSVPATLSDVIVVFSTVTVARTTLGSGKPGSGLRLSASATMAGERVRGAGEQPLGAGRIERDRHLLAGGVVEGRIGQRHRRLQARQRGTLPRRLDPARMLQHDGADRAGPLQRGPAHGSRLGVRAQRVRHRRRAADQVDRHLAAEVLAGEVVDLQLGNLTGRSRRRRAALRPAAPDRSASRTRRPARARPVRPCRRAPAPGSTAPRRSSAT